MKTRYEEVGGRQEGRAEQNVTRISHLITESVAVLAGMDDLAFLALKEKSQSTCTFLSLCCIKEREHSPRTSDSEVQ